MSGRTMRRKVALDRVQLLVFAILGFGTEQCIIVLLWMHCSSRQ